MVMKQKPKPEDYVQGIEAAMVGFLIVVVIMVLMLLVLP